jgi:membrane fusion protein, multidrug efflux system
MTEPAAQHRRDTGPVDAAKTMPAEIGRRRIIIGFVIVALALVVLSVVGILPRRAQQRQLAARSRAAALADSVPLVGVAQVSRSPGEADLLIPGTLQSNHETPVYARSSGYVQHWFADIGKRVHAGEVLATIEAPDLDQQLAQARQQVANAQATLQLNSVNLARWKVLYRDSTVTKQELDTYQSGYDASVASVAAADDNARRLAALVGYEQVTAPFDGVVTARNVEDGVFVTASGTTNTTQPAGTGGNTLVGAPATSELFRVASTDTVRVYLGVPQAYAPAVRVGLPTALNVQELPGRTFPGHITRTANAVDASSRTLLTEVDVINSDRALLPGMYAEVQFRFERSQPPILMPATAMIFRTSAPQAAVVGGDPIAHFHNLRIGRDYGTVIEVDSGLADGDLVVAEPTDDLRDGQPVHARIEADNGAPGGDTRAGRPIPPPPGSLNPQSQPRQQGGQAASGQSKQDGQKNQGSPSPSPHHPQSQTAQAKRPTDTGYHSPPQLQEGFPAAPPSPKP